MGESNIDDWDLNIQLYIYIYIYMYVCMYICVCGLIKYWAWLRKGSNL